MLRELQQLAKGEIGCHYAMVGTEDAESFRR